MIKEDCNRQYLNKDRMWRYFIFCEEKKEKRLAQEIFSMFEYYNIAISEYQCIPEYGEVGDDCTTHDKDYNPIPGICTLL